MLGRSQLIIIFGLLAGTGWLPCGPAFAQDVTASIPPKPVDETALRYYAMLHQTARVEMESRRLQRLYPGWNPPADLWTAKAGGPEEAPLWTLYAADDIAGLKAAIAKMQAQDPAWKPSDDLLRKMRLKEIRSGIVTAFGQSNWEEAERLSAKLGGGEPDDGLVWMLAEVLLKRDRVDDAEKMYRLVLQRSSIAKDRLTTMQKALGNLPIANAERLLLLGKQGPDGRSEFAELAIDVTRARITGFLRDQSRATIPSADLAALQNFARTSATPEPAGLLAWYALKRNDLQEALTWFKLSIGHGGDATIAHGLAQTLLRVGARREAEEVAYAWREPLVNNTILFIDVLGDDLVRQNLPLIEPERLARYAKVTMAISSGEGAQALAWYAYNSCQFDIALAWFQRAAAWFPKEATVYGYALTLQRLKRRAEFLEIVNRYDGLFPRVVGLLFRQDAPASPPSCDASQAQANAQAVGRVSIATPELPQWTMASTQGAKGWATIPDPSRYSDPRMMRLATAPVKQSEFPLAVAPENPLRFTLIAAAKDGPAAGWRVAAAGIPPRVARRVPGVGVMPYESLGYTLRPGWDGTDRPSSPTYAERPPIAGTLWSEQAQAAPANIATSSRGNLLVASPFERMRARTQ